MSGRSREGLIQQLPAEAQALASADRDVPRTPYLAYLGALLNPPSPIRGLRTISGMLPSGLIQSPRESKVVASLASLHDITYTARQSGHHLRTLIQGATRDIPAEHLVVPETLTSLGPHVRSAQLEHLIGLNESGLAVVRYIPRPQPAERNVAIIDYADNTSAVYVEAFEAEHGGQGEVTVCTSTAESFFGNGLDTKGTITEYDSRFRGLSIGAMSVGQSTEFFRSGLTSPQ